jgi:hypothetical protein
MTGEVSLAMTVLLGGLAIKSKDIAAGLGVAIAVLLFLKKPLRKFSQELLTEYELEDALILFAAALIVLPLLPQNAIDPWGALKPFAIWKVVVIIMCTGMLGHLAIRLKGLEWGLPIASLLSGLISSTAVIMDLGHKAKQDATMTGVACASALLSTLSSLVLFALVLMASSMSLFQSVALPLFGGGLSLLLTAIVLFRNNQLPSNFVLTHSQRAFQLKHDCLQHQQYQLGFHMDWQCVRKSRHLYFCGHCRICRNSCCGRWHFAAGIFRGRSAHFGPLGRPGYFDGQCGVQICTELHQWWPQLWPEDDDSVNAFRFGCGLWHCLDLKLFVFFRVTNTFFLV